MFWVFILGKMLKTVSCSSSRPQTPYVANNDLKLLVHLYPPESWNCKHVPSCLVCTVLGTELGNYG